MVVWMSGCHRWIQHINQVQKASLMNQKSGRQQDVFRNGVTTSKLGIKWMIPLDWGLFYPPFLNDCADLLQEISTTARQSCLVCPATQPRRLFSQEVVQGIVLNMLLPLACPPIIWAGSSLFISQKDEIRTTSGVPSDPSYLVGEVLS